MEETNVPKISEMKPKKVRKRRGFTFKTNERIYRVYFESFNNRMTKCYIREYKWVPEFDVEGTYTSCDAPLQITTFIGQALCNVDAGDVFNEEVGMEYSFDRAWKQVMHSLYNEGERFANSTAFTLVGLENKFDKLLRNGKIGSVINDRS